jgi:hypothetical protein
MSNTYNPDDPLVTQPMNEVPFASSIAGAALFGLNAEGFPRNFNISDIKGDGKGKAIATTNPGVPVLSQYYEALPGVTYQYFLDVAGVPITIPAKVGDQLVLSAKLVFDGAHWLAVYTPVAIELPDLEALKPRFPFRYNSDTNYYNAVGKWIKDLYLHFTRQNGFTYSFAIIQKNVTYVSLYLYSSSSTGEFTQMGVFSASAAQGYDQNSLEPFLIENPDFGRVVIIPGLIGTVDQPGLSDALLGFDSEVYNADSKFHTYLNDIDSKAEFVDTIESLDNFPYWPGVDKGWRNRFKDFLLDVNLTIPKDPNRYYSFAIINKNPTTVVLSLYSATDMGSGGANKIGDFGSNINLGYKPDSKEPFEISNEFGRIVISPGAIPTTNQAALFYVLNGLDDSVFEVNNKRSGLIRHTETKKALLRQPLTDWSAILNLMMFKGTVVVEFVGDSLFAGQEGEGITISQTMYDAVIDAFREYSVTPGVSPLAFSVINKGVGGTTTAQGVTVISQNTGGANVCIIMFAYNDMRFNIPGQYVSPDKYKANLDMMVSIAIGQGKVPVVCIEPNISTSFQTGLLTAYRNAVIEISKKYGLIYWDFTKQIWDIQQQPDGLHQDKYTYFGMGWDLAGLFTTMNYFNNIRPGKGDEILPRYNVQNVCGDGIKVANAGSASGFAFNLEPQRTIAFAFDIRDNASFYVKTLNTPGGAVSGKFSVNYYASLKYPMADFVPTGGAQKFTAMNIKAGKRLITIRNTSTDKVLNIESIGFE